MSIETNTVIAPTFDEWRRNKEALSRLECDLLLSHVTNMSRTQIVTYPDQRLNRAQLNELEALGRALSEGTPLAYLLGEKEFFGLAFEVSPAVLVPRPETELLVELALARMDDNTRLLDAGTGSGAVAVAIAHTQPNAQIDACDKSVQALEVARANARTHRVQINFYQSDWFAQLLDDKWHMIVSNPPYIAAGDSHLAALTAEPPIALVAENRGLAALAHIVEKSPRFLHNAGWLLLEHGHDQASSVRRLMTNRGFSEVKSIVDLGNVERVTLGQWYE